MEGSTVQKITRPLTDSTNIVKVLIVVLALSLLLGSATGYFLSTKTSKALPVAKPKTPQQDTKTFRDFAEGVVKPKPSPANSNVYTEGTHLLQRDGYPVALTSSVVDLSQYEGKKVKVYGETQKALKEGWLMDVGKVEEIK